MIQDRCDEKATAPPPGLLVKKLYVGSNGQQLSKWTRFYPNVTVLYIDSALGLQQLKLLGTLSKLSNYS